MVTLPRVVIAAPASGHGKTTVATGLMAALKRAGHTVSGHKVGPDYVDPGYHALATGRLGRNLDPHLTYPDLLAPMLLHGAAGADVAVVEGVTGLYDGMPGTDGFASTAHVASELAAPVVLVVDISHASRSIAALVHGMASYGGVASAGATRIAGVILNKAGSAQHADEVTAALEPTGIEVLGVLHRDDGISSASRHLGLVPADERADATDQLDRLATQITDRVDVSRVVQIAGAAPALDDAPWDPRQVSDKWACGRGRVVAVAGGRAFTFRYTETEELLRAAGCEPVVFDPTRDERLPAGTAGIYLGGGFPEAHAADLSANAPLRAHVRSALAAGVPAVAECAGLLYLCREFADSAGRAAPMVGAIGASARLSPSLTLGYRTAVAPAGSLLGVAGTRVGGHEFHRTTVDFDSACSSPAWLLDGRPDGFASDTLHASYLHTHWAGHPQLAERFVDAVRHAPALPEAPGVAAMGTGPATAPVPTPGPRAGAAVGGSAHEPDLHHHGDREAAEGLIDLAVNVAPSRPPWLDDALRESLSEIGRYPDATVARAALAERHGRSFDEVLPTSGGAEAFTLVARARPWRHAVVVHPQFTEPEAALRAAGCDAHRVLLRADDGFRLDPAAVPKDADLVMIGNPTNPTSILHSAATIQSLVRPGRVVVVDEAFMDAVPGGTESLAGCRTGGLVVVRSLTKTWAIPGLRAGYVAGDGSAIAELAAQQPPWSVSGPAAAAMVACSTEDATAEAESMAMQIGADRSTLVDGLRNLDLEVAGPAAAPFVLVRCRAGTRRLLRGRGFAVRRGDTFPGLSASAPDREWVRVAVRDRDVTASLLDAWRELV